VLDLKLSKEFLNFITFIGVMLGAKLGVAIAKVRNPMLIYVVDGVILPLYLLLVTAYLVKAGKIPRNRMKAWMISLCGLLIMSFSAILTILISGFGIILLLTGLLLTFLPFLIFKTGELKYSETPKSFLKRCIKCGKEIPIASEQCPHCGERQNGPRGK
jgi:hypothetical protein